MLCHFLQEISSSKGKIRIEERPAKQDDALVCNVLLSLDLINLALQS